MVPLRQLSLAGVENLNVLLNYILSLYWCLSMLFFKVIVHRLLRFVGLITLWTIKRNLISLCHSCYRCLYLFIFRSRRSWKDLHFGNILLRLTGTDLDYVELLLNDWRWCAKFRTLGFASQSSVFVRLRL